MQIEANRLKQDSLILSERIAAYLFNNQCVLSAFELKAGVETKQLRFTRGADLAEIQFSLRDGTLKWSCGENAGEARRGELFRLNPYEDKVKQVDLELPQRTGSSKWGKLKRYAGQISRHVRAGGFDHDTRRLFAELWGNLTERKRDRGAGFLSYWEAIGEGQARVVVLDFGGILDDNPNVEGAALGPRVMAHYYADAYAAYLFLRRFLDSNGPEWLEAALGALQFIARTYHDYPRGVVWYHHEFKNPAVLECIALMDSNQIVVPDEVRALTKRMHIDSYEPTNVFALRIYWKGALGKLCGIQDTSRIEACRKRLRSDSTESGLILDENPPSYIGARDLTYHQYSLACLAGYLTHCEDIEMQRVFLKGCEWTLNTRLPNGEVSYNGRGANNIYHVAAALYALSFAHARFGLEVGDLRPMLSLLSRWVGTDGSLPTGMNGYGNERMGWNHCRTPYNALTAYYLRLAADYWDKSVSMHSEVCANSSSLLDLSESGYVVFQNSHYSWVIFAGLRESYIYSNANQTGVSGTAVFCPTGEAPINLILNRSWRRPAALATDLPTVFIDGAKLDPIGGELTVKGETVEWRYKVAQFTLTRAYNFRENGVVLTNELKVHVACELAVDRWIAFPVHTDNYMTEVLGAEVKIKKKDEAGTLVCKIQIEVDELTESWEEEAVVSNPRGRGMIVKRGIRLMQVRAGAIFRSAWKVETYV